MNHFNALTGSVSESALRQYVVSFFEACVEQASACNRRTAPFWLIRFTVLGQSFGWTGSAL